MQRITIDLDPIFKLIENSTNVIIHAQSRIIANLENKKEEEIADKYLSMYATLNKNIVLPDSQPHETDS